MKRFDLIVVGAGPAGMSTAVEAARSPWWTTSARRASPASSRQATYRASRRCPPRCPREGSPASPQRPTWALPPRTRSVRAWAKTSAPGFAEVTLPYGFLPLTAKGDRGQALGRDGSPVREAEVVGVRRTVHDGLFAIAEVRRYPRCGMGLCQGQTCARLVRGVVARDLGGLPRRARARKLAHPHAPHRDERVREGRWKGWRVR